MKAYDVRVGFVAPLLLVAACQNAQVERHGPTTENAGGAYEIGSGGKGGGGERGISTPGMNQVMLPDASSTPSMADDGGVSGVGTGPICADLKTPLNFDTKIPSVIIAFDKSGSMTTRFGTGTRLSTELDVLEPLVLSLQDRIRWGFIEFPMNGSGTTCTSGCCADKVQVGVAPMNGAAVVDAMGGRPMGFDIRIGTPTGMALQTVADYFAMLPNDGSERFVLLSTDGEPTCPGADACETAVQNVAKLAASGVKTIVLGIGQDFNQSTSCLDRLANAGGVLRPGGPPNYYAASEPATLEKYLGEITMNLARPSCTLTLAGAPPDPKKVAVFLDDREIPWDPKHVNGWDYEGQSEVRLFGQACTDLQAMSAKSIRVLQGCPPKSID